MKNNNRKFKFWKRKIIKDVANLYRLKIQLDDTEIKDTENHFRQEKETKAIKDRILRDIKNLSQHKEEENFHNPSCIYY